MVKAPHSLPYDTSGSSRHLKRATLSLHAKRPGASAFNPAVADCVLEAAINGQADALVTYNIGDFAEAGKRFRISVLRPADLLKKVKA